MGNIHVAEEGLSGLEHFLCSAAAETLHKHYPANLWAVHPQGGLLVIRCLDLVGNWGFCLRTDKIYSASSFKHDIVRAGGEILERYKLARSGFRPGDVDALRTDAAGRHIPEM